MNIKGHVLYKILYGTTILFFTIFLANVYLLEATVVRKCVTASMNPRHVINIPWDIVKCKQKYPDNPFINVWYYNAVNLDPALLNPPKMVRAVMWTEMWVFSFYYWGALIGLTSGRIFDRRRVPERFVCVLFSGAQIFYTSLYLFWHYFVYDTTGYWINIFLPTTPWIIFPGVVAYWCRQ